VSIRDLLTKGTKTSPLAICDDIPRFYRDVCGLKINGNPRSLLPDEEPQAWMQQDPNSMSQHAARFFRKPLPEGKWGRLLLMPRGSGKSGIFRAECLRSVIVNRETTICYTSQNLDMSTRRVKWVKGRLTRNAGRFGAFQGDSDWSDDEFTVLRPSGPGEDPTMFATAPGKDTTGGHPRKFKLDDLVAKNTNWTPKRRRDLIEHFEIINGERTHGSTFDAIGTRWPNHTLYEELIDKYGDRWEIVIVEPWGPARDPNGNIVWDAPSDQLNFPWLTEEFLDDKRRINEKRFMAQYLNRKTTTDDAPYEASFLREGAPPMVGNTFAPHLMFYMLTDTAQSTAQDASRTAFIVICKGFIVEEIEDPNDSARTVKVHTPRTWIVDADVERYNSGDVEAAFMRMYYKWDARVDLKYATFESRGCSLTHQTTIPKLAEALGRKRPIIMPVPRASEESKNARIAQLYRPFKEGEIFFHTASLGGAVRPGLFRIDGRGDPKGVITEEILNYAPYGDGPNDFLDALADAYTVIKEGPLCPEPTHIRAEKRELSAVEWSRKRAAGQLYAAVDYI